MEQLQILNNLIIGLQGNIKPLNDSLEVIQEYYNLMAEYEELVGKIKLQEEKFNKEIEKLKKMGLIENS